MSFSQKVKDELLVACKRSCCICHKFCGTKIELHHIKLKSEGGLNTSENAIPLCLDCHADMSSYDKKHPKGTKYSCKELTGHRTRWLDRCSKSSSTAYDVDSKNLDISVFSLINGILKWNVSINFARNHIFSAPFRQSSCDQFLEFIHNCSDPAFEFIDADLESLRVELQISIDLFMSLIDRHTFYLEDNSDYSAVPQDWKSIDRNIFYNAVKELQSAGTRVGFAFDTLVRSARRRLGA